RGLSDLSPRKTLMVELFRPSDHKVARFPVTCRIDTETELEYFKAGGVMQYVLRNLARPPVEPVVETPIDEPVSEVTWQDAPANYEPENGVVEVVHQDASNFEVVEHTAPEHAQSEPTMEAAPIEAAPVETVPEMAAPVEAAPVEANILEMPFEPDLVTQHHAETPGAE
ncbi:MAG: hypothetical protein ACYDD1_15160, partial [Caulobacteraceae bacterium]